MSKLIETLLKEIVENRVIYGSKMALKQLKKNSIEKVYLATDCPLEVEQKLKEGNANIIKLNMSKEELKDLCKAPFNISVISVLKENKVIEKVPKEEKSTKIAREKNDKGKIKQKKNES